jgi:S-formylglutathione hydrolase FrmB
LKDVVPLIDRTYPTLAKPEGRLLLGFSKSGWGAFSLLLRHPETFGKAAAWDAPLMTDRPNKWEMGSVFGTQENFSGYQISELLKKQAGQFHGPPKLIHFGYDIFRGDHQRAEELMNELKITRVYRDGPHRKHAWKSGWVPEAVEMLVAQQGPEAVRDGKAGRTVTE